MNIVIPMAGHSRRFLAAGYTTPKPFIIIDGRPMIHRVCDMFTPKDRFVFVVLKSHLERKEYRITLESAAPRHEIVQIEPHEKGPVYSAYLAGAVMNASEPVIFTYCDFYQHWDYSRFLRRMEDYGQGMAVFRGFHPPSFGDTLYAYVKSNDALEMIELREKQSFTDKRHEEYASTGVYYVETWELYRKYSEELLQRGVAVGSEYYISLIYNLMVRDNLPVALFEVDKFICWGTPHDLERYRFWSSYFGQDLQKIKWRILSSDQPAAHGRTR